jgi:hypothetical protein
LSERGSETLGKNEENFSKASKDVRYTIQGGRSWSLTTTCPPNFHNV